jgi:hypothetical protein
MTGLKKDRRSEEEVLSMSKQIVLCLECHNNNMDISGNNLPSSLWPEAASEDIKKAQKQFSGNVSFLASRHRKWK